MTLYRLQDGESLDRALNRFRRKVAQAGIAKDVTPKTLRHSFATHLMDRGVDVAHISKLMGHAGPAESGVYLHVLPGRKRAAVEKLDKLD